MLRIVCSVNDFNCGSLQFGLLPSVWLAVAAGE